MLLFVFVRLGRLGRSFHIQSLTIEVSRLQQCGVVVLRLLYLSLILVQWRLSDNAHKDSSDLSEPSGTIRPATASIRVSQRASTSNPHSARSP